MDGRLSDRGLGSRSLGLGSRSVLRGWFRCAPLLRRLLLCRYRWAGSRFRLRRLRTGIGLVRRRVLAGRSHRGIGWARGYLLGRRCHRGVRRAAFGGIAIGPEEGLGSLPGALLAGVGAGFPCGWAIAGGV